jgi:hypothetical protein
VGFEDPRFRISKTGTLGRTVTPDLALQAARAFRV